MSKTRAPLVLATLNFPPTVGGVEQLCAGIARELAALDTSLLVLAPHAQGDTEFDAAAPYRVKRYPGGELRHLHLAREVAGLARAGQHRVLFAQWTGASLAVLHRQLFGSPRTMVTLAHAKEMLRSEQGARSTAAFAAYRRTILSRLSAVLAVSEYTADKARLAGARHVRRICPGVDAARFALAKERKPAPCPERPGPTILTLTRLVRRKGVDTLISSLPELARRHPNLRCVVAGGGPDRERLEQLASDTGVRERVVFLGRVPDEALPDLYASADVFALLSREDPTIGDVEGFGLVLLEAQAAGTPVIAARSGGMPDALVPDETGLLVPPNDPAMFAECAHGLLASPERLERFGRAAARHAAAQTWRRTAEQVLEAIDAVAD